MEGVHFHDLRHTGNTLMAQFGATLSDLMNRMGHASTRAAVIYLHTNSQRDRVVADGLNDLIAASRRGTGGHGPKIRSQPERSKTTEAPRFGASRVERVTGIEPALSAWETCHQGPIRLNSVAWSGHRRPELNGS